jgi:hypothetical protein
MIEQNLRESESAGQGEVAGSKEARELERGGKRKRGKRGSEGKHDENYNLWNPKPLIFKQFT